MPFRACYHGLCHANVRNRPDILFHAFPRPAENDPVQIYECHQWIKACGRQPSDLNFDLITEDYCKPSRSRKYFVCADHFVDRKPTKANPYPLPALPSDTYTVGSKRTASLYDNSCRSKRAKHAASDMNTEFLANDSVVSPRIREVQLDVGGNRVVRTSVALPPAHSSSPSPVTVSSTSNFVQNNELNDILMWQFPSTDI